ncbi:MAG: protein kinase, partial [Woeseiaceae bacterium]
MTAPDQQAEWRELWAIFHEALEIGAAERAGFLDRACADIPGRRDKLEKMLAAHGSVGDDQLPSLAELLDDVPSSDDPGRLAPGDQLGPYRIDELIGEGGMGIVYRAHQAEPVRRIVALKVLQHGMVSRDVVSRFNAERQALAMMSHSNIAKVFDAGTTDLGQPYFAMEYVAGKTVTEYCDSEKLGIDARLRLFVQICDGVLHAHQKGITHRD